MTYSAMVIGLGQIGMGYDLESKDPNRVSTLARAFASHPAFNLVCGVDSSTQRCELFSVFYGAPAYQKLEDALGEMSPDIVAIATPTETHHDILAAVIEFGKARAILCEKPLSYDIRQAEAMVVKARSRGVKLYTNYMRRCDSGLIEVKRRLTNGEIVTPIKGLCWYTKGLFNNGSHLLNLCEFWFGEVTAYEIIRRGRMWDGRDPEPDLKVCFGANEVYFHSLPEEHFSYNSIELMAVNGRLSYGGGRIFWQGSVPDSLNQGYVTLDRTTEDIASDTLRLQWFVADQIDKDLRGEDISICSGAQGLSTIQILASIVSEL